ncbi:MAG: DUF1028 domain-containing protein [Candidatus Eisenbacteria bacterium]|uniref:DUF1028 domain-containing protein n=1 Tax=Eiseniibacteriota bacterium TaxID=2212470 RepID=A0A948WEF6_UNCEI|nr:DUF1028 domain-containing protein [Candidatus Eisenbacteria bacterium]MBU1949818.1 DUF1028 domain-containing protein [Candidatus Eisenbacteria bacterium]MBU2692723.1 DUF1028 domain-containing protein [Candidatus Eisenbacteria bacterium]
MKRKRIWQGSDRRGGHLIGGILLLLTTLITIFITTSISNVWADESFGTFSIAAYDAQTGEVGVAVQSRVFSVGPRVAWVKGGVGAIATQAQSNETFGPRGLLLMETGLSAEETLEWLLAQDPGRENRQVGIVDINGGVANWTGSGCADWAGDSSGTGFTCQGNILANAEVVAGMIKAFQETEGQELARRMIAALHAAQAAGGDKRGQQSAAILIGRTHPDFPEYAYRYIDIRVEDHTEPIAELDRLYQMYEAQGLVQAHLNFSDWMEANGDMDGARYERERVAQVLTRALKEDVRDAEMLNSLAWFAATHDFHLPEALEAAQRAVGLEPKNSNILDTLGETHYRMGHYDKAIEVQNEAIAIAPDDEYLKEQLKKFEKAKAEGK